jgi:DNA-binding HxlR family transcriptional regulator
MSCWLEIFGDKWTLIILRDMMVFGKRNYKDFINSNEKIATNILASRLRLLVENGIITKTKDTKNRLIINYEPTQKAYDLKPIFSEVMNWSNVHVKETLSFPELLE